MWEKVDVARLEEATARPPEHHKFISHKSMPKSNPETVFSSFLLVNFCGK